MNCRSCYGINLKLVINLGYHAWCNHFLQEQDIGTEQIYPLRMFQCLDCELCQLDITIPKETMFTNHTYVSGTTKSLAKHFYDTAKENIQSLNLNIKDLIYDIGGNDGTQLIQYKKLGYHNVVNIESASNIAKLSRENGILTINTFFNEDTVIYLGENKVKVINAAGVFFHLEELHSVTKGIKRALTEDGVFIVQFMYLGDMLQNTAFDSIYHEHLCYYSLQSLINLLKPYNINIFDAYHTNIHGGTIIAKFCNNQYYKPTNRLQNILDDDKLAVNCRQLNKFENQVINWKKKFIKNIIEIKKNNHKIYAIGAPAKGNTLLTYCNLDTNIIECIFEVNNMKCGLCTPITHIPIVKENHSMIKNDSYIILLSWNFADEIISKSQDLIDRGIQFILPFTTNKIKNHVNN